MTELSATLKRAIAKLEHEEGNKWRGYLLPVEMLALIDAGAKLNFNHESTVEYLQNKVDQGHSGGCWHYFQAKRGLQSQLEKLVPKRANSKVGTKLKR